MLTRREFLQLSVGAGALAAVGPVKMARAQPASDYKALVCVFLHGGNDGHNMLVSLQPEQYAAYQAARGVLALPANQLLPVNDPAFGTVGLHGAMPEVHALFNQGQLAILANAGILTAPTTYEDLSDDTFRLPFGLRSHATQIASMQTGSPDAGGVTGWGGRALDLLETHNAGTDFPVAIALGKPAIYCAGMGTQDICLQPGGTLEQQGLRSAQQPRRAAQQQILGTASGNAMVDAANAVMASANGLHAILATAGAIPAFPKPFPSGELGGQLKEVARLISLNAQYGVGRQIFFCDLNGFDTHFGQATRQAALLQQLSRSLDAFYAAMSFLGLDEQVTTFTLSDFGRTLTPSGTGTDHGWGNHHLILGGAVDGGRIYGRLPSMTNHADFNESADDFSDGRGAMLPAVSLAQYGATLARWFGTSDEQLDSVFPELPEFTDRTLPFMA
jgi:uncharacterized protein (DUF1501 family)